MTNQEMTELFSVMLLAWPQAEMFKGGIAKLGPTIELWTACTRDIDFWTGQQAVVLLCKTSKFPPTIANKRPGIAFWPIGAASAGVRWALKDSAALTLQPFAGGTRACRLGWQSQLSI